MFNIVKFYFILCVLFSGYLFSEEIDEVLTSPTGTNYRVVRSIRQRGLFGPVLLVKREKDGKLFIYKTFTDKLGYEFAMKPALTRTKMLQEKANSDHMARIEEFGDFVTTSKKYNGVVTEKLEGVTLREFTWRNSSTADTPQAIVELKGLVDQLLNSVIFAAKNNVVMGDTKSENLMVSRDAEGKLKLKYFDYDSVGIIGDPVFVHNGLKENPKFNHPMMDLLFLRYFLPDQIGPYRDRENLRNKLKEQPEAKAALEFLERLDSALNQSTPAKKYKALEDLLVSTGQWSKEDVAPLKPPSPRQQVRNAFRFAVTFCSFVFGNVAE